MDILFVHQNFPAQFIHVAQALKHTPGVRVAAVTDMSNEKADMLPSARYRWDARRAGSPQRIWSNYALRASRGRMAARAMAALRNRGFSPAVIVGHVGWGETLFAKDVFPDAKLIVHAEFFYSSRGADVDFDQEFPRDRGLDWLFELRAKNAAIIAALTDADVGVAPTRWQASRFPAEFRSKLRIVHEGIDTIAIKPDAEAVYRDRSGDLALRSSDEVITFVNRNLEPYRGYHIFMRALPTILASRPRAHAVIVGGDGNSYGAAPKGGRTWKDIFLSEVGHRLPMERVHFVSNIPFPDFVSLMQISSAHVYLTYPFVLSWSMLQAMAAGAPLIASRTAPVLEAVEDGVNGVLVDFFAVEELSRRVVDVLARPEAYREMRAAGRDSVLRNYDLATVCLPRWLALLGLK
jgi:glycosyltransferase involved in cell wall biosynthesis